jgi:DNA repair exonuclease SbcCD nuclease subunit
MKTLIIGDNHISDSSIEEINTIYEKDIFTIKADRVIQLGDLFDKNRPTPKEIRFTTQLIHKLSTLYKEVILLAGNGTHEFLNEVAIIEYLKEISGKIKIETKDHFILGNVYYGHHMLTQSRLEYGTGKFGLKELKNYDYSILAHQHSFQKFNSKVYHIGSIRYQHFNESSDKEKYIATITDGKLEFIPLSSVIKMRDFHSLEELDKAEEGIKARLVLSSFDQFKKSVNNIQKFKLKFKDFKVKLDFSKEVKSEISKKETSNKKLEEILQEGIEKVQDKEVRDLLKEALK